MKKTLRIFVNIFMIILITCAAVMILPTIFGIQTLPSLTDNMQPSIPSGSLVFVVPSDPKLIQTGDIISFPLPTNVLATRRVEQTDHDTQRFTVKDDNSGSDDSLSVFFENVIGIVKFSIPLLGYGLHFFLSAKGRMVTAAVGVAMILLLLLINDAKKARKVKKTHRPQYIPGVDLNDFQELPDNPELDVPHFNITAEPPAHETFRATRRGGAKYSYTQRYTPRFIQKEDLSVTVRAKE